LKKVYHNATDIESVTLLVDVYVMLYVHIVLFLCIWRKGPAGASGRGKTVLLSCIYISYEGRGWLVS